MPNITFGAPVIGKIRTTLPKDTHLMIEHPLRYLESFVKAGANPITIHVAAVEDSVAALRTIQSYGVRAGISLRPGTPVEMLLPVLDMVDLVLVMTVEPGFGGQKFMEEQLEKVRYIRARYPLLDIAVDGGITVETAPRAVQAGANVLVAGSSVYGQVDRAGAIEALRKAC